MAAEKFNHHSSLTRVHLQIYSRLRVLKDLNIHIDALRLAISDKLPEYDVVTTGYSSYEEVCKNTIGFGADTSSKLFVQIADEGTICAAWSSEPMVEFLNLNSLGGLLYVDWAWGFVCPLSDHEVFLGHIAERIEFSREQFAQFENERALRQYSNARKKWWQFW